MPVFQAARQFPKQGKPLLQDCLIVASGKCSSGVETDKIFLLFLTPVGRREVDSQLIRASGTHSLRDYPLYLQMLVWLETEELECLLALLVLAALALRLIDLIVFRRAL